MSIFEEWTVLSSVWLRGMDLLIFMVWFGDSVQWDGELETDTVGHCFLWASHVKQSYLPLLPLALRLPDLASMVPDCPPLLAQAQLDLASSSHFSASCPPARN
jgi:hypothetical protein